MFKLLPQTAGVATTHPSSTTRNRQNVHKKLRFQRFFVFRFT